jgi:hypothetical protein
VVRKRKQKKNKRKKEERKKEEGKNNYLDSNLQNQTTKKIN